ncbi:hypothetical protein HMPREF1640_02975 [Prevotella sp. S7-1-8]|nr:hypothetical protein HMPREF1640_02975 [Prevotella sp. S7-1-8]
MVGASCRDSGDWSSVAIEKSETSVGRLSFFARFAVGKSCFIFFSEWIFGYVSGQNQSQIRRAFANVTFGLREKDGVKRPT